MKALSWAKEKLHALAAFIGRKQYGEIPRFNNLAPIVQPPGRAERSRQRKLVRWLRWKSYNAQHGCPGLSGERLRKTAASCDPSNLIVQPRYRRQAYAARAASAD